MNSEYPAPKFNIGDQAQLEISGEIEGVLIKSKVIATVVQITLDSDCEKRLLRYGLTDQPCGPYFAGRGVRWTRAERELCPPPEKRDEREEWAKKQPC